MIELVRNIPRQTLHFHITNVLGLGLELGLGLGLGLRVRVRVSRSP